MSEKVHYSDNRILIEMCVRQRANVQEKYKLSAKEMRRLIQSLEYGKSIFGSPTDPCVLWTGYMVEKDGKYQYVNFYIRNKRYSLHRVLYDNFIGSADESKQLKHICSNPAICCNLGHIVPKRPCKSTNEDSIIVPNEHIHITKINGNGSIVLILDN